MGGWFIVHKVLCFHMELKSLYKYMPHYEGSFFDNFLLRATERSDLNDPFEFLPPKDFFYAVVEHATRIDKEWVKSITYDDFRKSFYLFHGVLCFTETRSNLLMWAHYAQRHTGIVIEFDIQNEFFESVRRVRYDNLRPQNVNVGELDDLFFIKSDEWIYEKEYRIVKQKKDHDYFMRKSDMVMVPAKNSAVHSHEGALEMYFFKVPKECIKSVTFGIDMNLKIKELIMSKIVNDNDLSHIKLWNANLSKEYYSLEFEELENIQPAVQADYINVSSKMLFRGE